MNHLPRRAAWLACVTAAFILAGVASASAAPVVVGVYPDSPKVYTDDKGRPSGIFIDLLEKMAKEEGWEIKYVRGSWAACVKGLRTGDIDILPGVAYLPSRDERFDYHAVPVVKTWSHVYSKPDADIDRLAQLDGGRLAVSQGLLNGKDLERSYRGFGYEMEMVAAESPDAAFDMVRRGKVDGAIADQLSGDYVYRNYGLDKTPIVVDSSELYFVTAEGKNRALLSRIDVYMNYWLDEPGSTYYRTLARYSGVAPAELPSPFPVWAVVLVFAVAVTATGSTLLMRWRLDAQTRQLREARAIAEAARETLRLALDAADEGVFDWNPQTGSIAWTPSVYEMLGYEADEFPVSMELWTSFLHPDDIAEVLRTIWEGITQGDRSFTARYRMRMKDGDYVSIATHGRVVELDSDGQVLRVLGTHALVVHPMEPAPAPVSRRKGGAAKPKSKRQSGIVAPATASEGTT